MPSSGVKDDAPLELVVSVDDLTSLQGRGVWMARLKAIDITDN